MHGDEWWTMNIILILVGKYECSTSDKRFINDESIYVIYISSHEFTKT